VTETAQTPAERRLSYPKEKIRVLLLENIHPAAVDAFQREGYQVETIGRSLAEDELLDAVADIHILGIRSNTRVTEPVLARARHLHAVGAFCIGTNQIDLPAAAAHGTAVFNAPFSNTRSVVELVVSELIALNRGLTDKNARLHAGVWDKSATGAHEIRGQKLGIVGYGSIGSQLSVLAESLGMEVLFFDVTDKLRLGNAHRCESLDELLSLADAVTIHVDGRSGNRGFFGDREFAQMKPGAVFLNLSRGFVIDLAALRRHLESGHLAGAAIDVFPSEPKSRGDTFSSELQGVSNVILTPHIGGSTEEAQDSIGNFVSGKLINFVNTGSTSLAVNLPNLILPAQQDAHRLILIHRNVPGALAKINQLLADCGANIVGQHLGTYGDVGYVITDVDTDYSPEVRSVLRDLPETIRLRVLY
jgi:D-3-phosphoglycerate dehydrogenase / 2-oxoglutarate reductase